MDKSSFFSSLIGYVKANRPFFLLVLLIVLTVGGYFWWQAGFTLDVNRFFAATACEEKGLFNSLAECKSVCTTSADSCFFKAGEGCYKVPFGVYCQAACDPYGPPNCTKMSPETNPTRDGCANAAVEWSGTFDIEPTYTGGFPQHATFHSKTAGCAATTEEAGLGGSITAWDNPPGTYSVKWDPNADVHCGRYQFDVNLGAGKGIGKVFNWGVNCGAPSPVPSPSPSPSASPSPSPSPSATVTPTPSTTVTPVPLVCAPTTQTVNVGQTAQVTASGGTGAYNWTAPTGTPGTGSGSSFGTSYATPGSKAVVVVSGNNQASCTIVVVALATSTPPNPPLVCAPANQTVQINQAASFQASGGSLASGTNAAQYTWIAETGVPAGGTGPTFSTVYQTVGTKTVTVRDALNQTATCAVSVAVTPTPTSPLLTIQKLVRNMTQNGGEADSVNANPTDTVEFSVRVSSLGSGPALAVIVRDTLPAGLTYVPGSTTIDGVTAADGIMSTGLNLGDMATGRSITVRFRAAVAAATFFATGTNVLTNTAYARGSNVPEVSDVAFVTVINAPQNLSMSLVKMGRNVSRGQTAETSPVYSAPGQTVEFILRVRNTSNAPLTNVLLRDIVPAGITAIPGSVRVGGSPAPDALTGSGLSLGTLAVGQEVAVTFQGRVADATALPAGTTTLINTAQVTATGVGPLTAQLPVIIENAAVVVPPVDLGPGESTVLALIISGIITLLYVGYTGTDTYRRREVGDLVNDTKDSTFNFRR